jgi:hypothetical protein
MGTPGVAEASQSAKPQWRLKTTFWLDVALLVSIAALQTVSFTGLVIHEWLGLAVVGVVFAHLLFSWSWIASLSRRLFAVQSARARVNYLLNLSLFAAVTAVIFSGILISQKAVPALLGTKAAPAMDWRWDYLHNLFSPFLVSIARFNPTAFQAVRFQQPVPRLRQWKDGGIQAKRARGLRPEVSRDLVHEVSV